MRIGIIVDGESEVAGLPAIYAALAVATGHTILHPTIAKIDPAASVESISRVLMARLRFLEKRELDRAVILIDREQQQECPGELARRLRKSVEQRANWKGEIEVVVKDRTFENWLIADPNALRRQLGRFQLTASIDRDIAPNKADHVEALAMLRSSVISRPSYNKIQDSKRILANADVDEIAANSRSFRRFLRCLDHPPIGIRAGDPKRPVHNRGAGQRPCERVMPGADPRYNGQRGRAVPGNARPIVGEHLGRSNHAFYRRDSTRFHPQGDDRTGIAPGGPARQVTGPAGLLSEGQNERLNESARRRARRD